MAKNGYVPNKMNTPHNNRRPVGLVKKAKQMDCEILSNE
jgi:hypothetical protein